ncbi:MAG: futalosine hydrolase [Nitrospirae bacterium]|nr:futalosine hydrolase [Nitrospirota bacterium]
MPFESASILTCLKKPGHYLIAGKPVHKGKLSGVDVVLMNSGMGKVNAAHSATYIIEKYPVSAIINIGVGGAYPGSGLKAGDIAFASKEIYGDEGVIGAEGWGGLEKIGIPLVKEGRKRYFNEYPLNSISPSVYKGKNRMTGWNCKIMRGNFVTVSAVSGTQRRARELERRFNAVCENMEGAAIAQVCTLYKVPMFEIRGISNIAGSRDKTKWDLQLASGNCQKLMLDIIDIAFNGPDEGTRPKKDAGRVL